MEHEVRLPRRRGMSVRLLRDRRGLIDMKYIVLSLLIVGVIYVWPRLRQEVRFNLYNISLATGSN